MIDSSKPVVHFWGLNITADEYQDDSVLDAYIIKNYYRLMTPLERRRLNFDIPIVSDLQLPNGRRLYENLEEKDGHVEDEDLIAAFKIDREIFRKQVVQRLLNEHAEQISINRCGKCNRIVFAPSGKRCPWCSHTWY